tara:strand:- start:1325 stop:2329 length:1005 start_codon:yes stop_codon:yes gene_type:complete
MIKNIFLNDKILLLGGKGMVGSSIKRALYKYEYGKEKNNGIIYTPTRSELDLLNENAVKNWFREFRPTVVILAAAKVGGIYANATYPADFLLENLRIQTNVIESAWKEGVRRLLFLGSSCIYPKFSHQPIKEDYLLTSDLEVTNECYAIAKIAGLKLCESLRNQYGFDALSVMPTNLYGPNDNYHSQNSHVMASFIKKFLLAKKQKLPSVTCWGTGNALREFLHVDDLAEAIIFCLENWNPSEINAPRNSQGKKLNHINIGTGKDISIKNLAKKISEIVEYHGEINWDKSKPDGTPRKILDVSLINNLGWEAKIDLDIGIKKTIQDLDICKLGL